MASPSRAHAAGGPPEDATILRVPLSAAGEAAALERNERKKTIRQQETPPPQRPDSLSLFDCFTLQLALLSRWPSPLNCARCNNHQRETNALLIGQRNSTVVAFN